MTTYTYEKPKRSMSDAPLAELGPRLIALFVDTMILGMIGGAGAAGAKGPGFIVGLLIGIAYHWFFLTQNNGQTLGKMLMGIRVVKVTGEPLTATDVVLRYLGYWLNSAVFAIGWFWAAFDENRQGWHDKIAGTIVVQAR